MNLYYIIPIIYFALAALLAANRWRFSFFKSKNKKVAKFHLFFVIISLASIYLFLQVIKPMPDAIDLIFYEMFKSSPWKMSFITLSFLLTLYTQLKLDLPFIKEAMK